MAITARTKTISMSIGRSPEAVYEYVRHAGNFPEWAKSFCQSISKSGDRWLMETPAGPATLRFVPSNDYGVLDHYVGTVQKPDDAATGAGSKAADPPPEIYVPLRVVANGPGSEIIFTLFQSPGVSDEDFAKDTAMVRSDLEQLKKLLES